MNGEISSCASAEPFALRVIGDDMAPEFVDGHVIVVDPGGKLAQGCYVVARHRGEVMLRQLDIDDGVLRLRALNPAVAEVVLENGIDDIVGVVSQRAGKRRREHKRYDS